MLKRVEIRQLFGRFTYEIEMKSDGITIITGPNGFGKSTILKIIDAISSCNLFYFMELNFSLIIVTFINGKQVKIEKNTQKIIFNGIEIPFASEKINWYLSERRLAPWLRKVPDGWIDMRNREFVDDSNIFYNLFLEDNYINDKIDSIFNKKAGKDLKELFLKIKKYCGEVRLISEQRLIRKVRNRTEDSTIVDVITELPNKLKTEISNVSDEYSKVSNTLDSSYPKRLFETKNGLEDENEYQDKLNEANKKFEKLNKYNLVDMTLFSEAKYNTKYSTALKIYFDDFSEKYKVFELLISKLDLFTKIINERLTFKKIKISSEKGFEVIDDDSENKTLDLDQLSSGEKQEIILFYNLIFNTTTDLMLLIDEPEISLHITWQKKFLDDLLEVSKIIKFQAIVATHSPQIVSNHWDIQIDLGELYGM